MPYYKTSQEWLEQSVLLLEARPTTTRITTKYSLHSVKSRSKKNADDGNSTDDAGAEPKPPRGSLVLKTYDPVSGVTLKYRTAKAAEVSRLIYSSLGRLGRGMAAVPEPADLVDEAMIDVPGTGEATPASGAPTSQQQGQQGGGGGKKKKKGKK